MASSCSCLRPRHTGPFFLGLHAGNPGERGRRPPGSRGPRRFGHVRPDFGPHVDKFRQMQPVPFSRGLAGFVIPDRPLPVPRSRPDSSANFLVANRVPVSYLHSRRAGAFILDALMLALIAIAGLLGPVLALRFNMLSLVPATAFLLAITATSLLIRGDAIWWVGIVMFATAASLQLSYFAANLLRMLLLGKWRPTPFSGDRPSHHVAPRLVPGQPDREIAIEAAQSPDRTPRRRTHQRAS
jgi:hypothetical protein